MPKFTFNHKGQNYSFDIDGETMVDATVMAKPFNKKVSDWIKTQSAQDYINAYSIVKNIDIVNIVVSKQGGKPSEQGTWLHEDIALEFARWLSIEFGIWRSDIIKRVLIEKSRLTDEEIKNKFINGDFKFSIDEIKGRNGAKYIRMPADYSVSDDVEWGTTLFKTPLEQKLIITATIEQSNWYALNEVLRLLEIEKNDFDAYARSIGYRGLRILMPYGKGTKRYFASENIVSQLGFSENNHLNIKGIKYKKEITIDHFAERINRLISMVDEIEDKEFLIDIYKLLK